MNKVNYECCRCGYSTYQKTSMRYHLYVRKHSCPATQNVIELTEEIKVHILSNKVYNIPISLPATSSKTTNNINAIINNIPPSFSNLNRLKAVSDFEGNEIINLFKYVETIFHKEINKLQNDSFKYNYELNQDAFFDIFDKISHRLDPSFKNLNIVFDGHHVNILDDDDTWMEELIDKGVKIIVDIVQIMFLNEYEKYVLRKIKQMPYNQNRQHLLEALATYYRFISCFDLKPYCNRSDDYILKNFYKETFTISDEFDPVFKECSKSVTKKERNDIQKKVFLILNRNFHQNMKYINHRFITMYSSNDAFQKSMQSLNPCSKFELNG